MVAFASLVCACTSLSGLSGGPNQDAAIDVDGRDAKTTRSPEGPSSQPEEVACESGEDSCDGVCVDLASDPDNCGRCGHGCLGGACVQSTCQPVSLASGLARPQGIAVGPDALYVTLQYEHRIVRIPKGGGTAETVTTATTSPGAIAASFDGPKRLVWGETRGAASNVVFCEVPCESPRKVPAGGDVWHVTISGGFAYWATSSDSAGAIRRCPVEGCSVPYEVVTDQPRLHGLVVSGGQLAFGTRSARGTVRRASTSGGGLTDLIRELDQPQALATDGATLFVAARGSNVIARCPLTGCDPGEQATIALAKNPHGIATDGENVYWSNGMAVGGTVAWCPADACSGSGHVLAAEQANPYAIALDDEAVYWTNAVPKGQVMKIARP